MPIKAPGSGKVLNFDLCKIVVTPLANPVFNLVDGALSSTALRCLATVFGCLRPFSAGQAYKSATQQKLK